MKGTSVDQFLEDCSWVCGASCDVQVVPHNRRPGDFLARVIVKETQGAQAEPHSLLSQIAQCGDISELHVFVESQQAENEPSELAEPPAAHSLPEAVSRASTSERFPNGCKYFQLQPGQLPSEPVYPVWTRDIQRSTQVVDGKYSEIVPLTFEFVPTLNCVFRCDECAYREPKERLGLWKKNDFSPAFHMDETTMKVLLEKLRDAGVDEVLFTGGGEPLLAEPTPDAMKYAHQELGLRVGLYTNGVLVDQRRAKAIIEARPAYVRLSLNAGQKRVYYEHHCPLAPDDQTDYFANSQRGLELLARMKGEGQNETTLGVSYLVDPRNANDVVNASRLVTSLARRHEGMINYMRFTPSVNYFGPKQHPRDLFDSAVDLIEKEAVPMLEAAGVDTRIYRHRFRGLYEQRPYNKCLAASWYGGVGPGGVLYWCCEKLFNGDFAFGSLLNSTFDELWSSEGRRRVIDFASRAVRGETDSPCPVVCKPHEHNKVFGDIERLREQGRIAVVSAWLERIHGIISSTQEHAKPRFDGFQS